MRVYNFENGFRTVGQESGRTNFSSKVDRGGAPPPTPCLPDESRVTVQEFTAHFFWRYLLRIQTHLLYRSTGLFSSESLSNVTTMEEADRDLRVKHATSKINTIDTISFNRMRMMV